MTSVAILTPAHPTPLHTSFSMAAPLHTTTVPQNKKPRLSLNTTCNNSIGGRNGTGLRLDTLSATSPTVRNTFHNTFDASTFSPTTVENTKRNARKANDDSFTHNDTATNQRSVTAFNVPTIFTPITPPTPSTPSKARCMGLTLNTALSEDTPSTEAHTSPPSSVSSTDSSPPPMSKMPYSVTGNVRSILSNSPIQHWRAQRRTTFSPVKRRFPPIRRVGFKSPLCEDVVNVRFQLSNFDIVSAAPSPVVEEREQDVDQQTTLPSLTVTAPSEEVEVESHALPKTPVAGRLKRERNWVWTLGPVAGQKGDAATTSAESNEQSQC